MQECKCGDVWVWMCQIQLPSSASVISGVCAHTALRQLLGLYPRLYGLAIIPRERERERERRREEGGTANKYSLLKPLGWSPSWRANKKQHWMEFASSETQVNRNGNSWGENDVNSSFLSVLFSDHLWAISFAHSFISLDFWFVRKGLFDRPTVDREVPTFAQQTSNRWTVHHLESPIIKFFSAKFTKNVINIQNQRHIYNFPVNFLRKKSV